MALICGEKMLTVDKLDHLVLTVRSIAMTCSFYARVLGMEVVETEPGRKALKFGDQKINLHEVGRELELRAHQPIPGSADLCFITRMPLQDVIAHLHACNVELIAGPIQRMGARRKIYSIYLRDPDYNLIELANYA
ncbi:VOC family protein [Tengunoibacter tsumagoiensis]|uniref:Virulence protein n=1 Tax=Tengunoibacter tsumagoiensis TaxID=2014871 RepID=A0A401ZUN1_9CHLR|nr:VOC family protein [Tengunoibacter tsumagoiensis]GCE10496.1 virulence protein [Tengunoibacter tsumagoiensis]